MADRRVFSVTLASRNRANYHLACVHSNPSLQRQFSLHPQSVRVAFEIPLHPEGSIECTLRVVIMGERSAKQGKDAITRLLHDISVVAMDRVDHQLERGIDSGTGLFRVEVLHQLHRTFDVGE